jgi:hypothetical protein
VGKGSGSRTPLAGGGDGGSSTKADPALSIQCSLVALALMAFSSG